MGSTHFLHAQPSTRLPPNFYSYALPDKKVREAIDVLIQELQKVDNQQDNVYVGLHKDKTIELMQGFKQEGKVSVEDICGLESAMIDIGYAWKTPERQVSADYLTELPSGITVSRNWWIALSSTSDNFVLPQDHKIMIINSFYDHLAAGHWYPERMDHHLSLDEVDNMDGAIRHFEKNYLAFAGYHPKEKPKGLLRTLLGG
ncbi:MAG: hypothetical protein HGA85_07705 [Nanoarchaeota archaeon]|nr:hypothetical protein [Nanoarchaeota archaeon]